MRVLAGVLLVLMFVVNGVAGLGYTLGGAFFKVGGEAVSDLGQQEEGQGKKDEAKAATESSASAKKADEKTAAAEEKLGKDLQDGGKKARQLGGALLGLVGGLALLSIAQLVFAIFLFQDKATKLPLFIVGGFGVAAEVLGSLLTAFGPINALGLAAAVVVIVHAATMKAKDPNAQPQYATAGGYPGQYPQPVQPQYPQVPQQGPPGYGPPPGT